MRRNPWLADFRVRSTFSSGTLSIPELVDLYGSRGFGAIAITDVICKAHSFRSRTARLLNYRLTEANFPLYREILLSEARRAWLAYGMTVISGIEIPHAMGSTALLGLGIESFVPTTGDAGEIANSIREQGGLVVASRPSFNSDLLREVADACEVTNGRDITFNSAMLSGLPLLASSGFRKHSHLSSWKTSFTCARSQTAIFEAIRRRDMSLQFYAEERHDGDSGSVFSGGLVGRRRARRLWNSPSLASFQDASGS